MMFCVCVVTFAVLVSAGAWDVPCSSITPVNDVPMSQFRGQWMAMETYNDERMRNVVPTLCLRMDLNSVNATRLDSESTATEMSIGFKTYKKAIFDLDNPSKKGQWAARLVNGDETRDKITKYSNFNMAMEGYDDVRLRNSIQYICLRMDLSSVNATRLEAEATATVISIGTKTHSKAIFDLDNPSKKGQWTARRVNDNDEVTEEHANLWLLAADPSLYFTQVRCYRDPETSILQVKDLITWRRVNQTLSEQNIVDLRNAVKSSLNTTDLEALNFNSSC